jgi:hypothetical protein
MTVSLYGDLSPYPGFDVVVRDEPLRLYGWLSCVLVDTYGNWYARPVYIELMAALKEMRCCDDDIAKACSFTVWVGDNDLLFCAGISEGAPESAKRILADRFARLEGFSDHLDLADEEASLVPMFRYEAGNIILYAEQDRAGKRDIDSDYGSGLPVEYRYAATGEEVEAAEAFCGWLRDSHGSVGCDENSEREGSDAADLEAFPEDALDMTLAEAAERLARWGAASPNVTPRELVGLGRALYALQRLPLVTPGVWVEVTLYTGDGDKDYSERHYWSFQIVDCGFYVSEGGSVYDPGVGSDSYTTFAYEVETSGYTNTDGDPYDWVCSMNEALGMNLRIGVDDQSQNVCMDDK